MRLFFIVSIVYMCQAMSCGPSRLSRNKYCSEILDSANAFIKTSKRGFVSNQSVYDKSRNMEIDLWLQKKSFKDLTCLLEHESYELKYVGFIYASFAYPDSLVKRYSYLLSDTTLVKFHSEDGITKNEKKFGTHLSSLLQMGRASQEESVKKQRVEEVIPQFIMQYSAFPDSYQPVTLSYYRSGSVNEGNLTYQIAHEYRIKDKRGGLSVQNNYFILDSGMEISGFKKNEHSFFTGIGEWLEVFGRNLEKSDSLKLRLK